MTNYNLNWDDNYEKQFCDVVIDGIKVRVEIERDDFLGGEYLLEGYDYLVLDVSCDDMTDMDVVDELYEDGEITEQEHMEAHANGWRSYIRGSLTQVNMWESARKYQEFSGNKNLEECFKIVDDAVDNIRGWYNDEWHHATVSAHVVGHEDDYAESCGGYESYLFEEGEHSKYGDEIILDMAKQVAHEYKTKGNYKQDLLPIDN